MREDEPFTGKRKRRQSLVVKLFLLVSLLIIASALASSYIVSLRQDRLYRRNEHRQILSVAKSFALVMAGDLAREKYDSVSKTLITLVGMEDVAYFKAEDVNGETVYYSDDFRHSSYYAGKTFRYTGKGGGELQFMINDRTPQGNSGSVVAKVGGGSFRIFADREWQGTGVRMKSGDEAAVSASGEWLGKGTRLGPDGTKTLISKSKFAVFVDQYDFSLIARVDDGTGTENLEVVPSGGPPRETNEVVVDVVDVGAGVGSLTIGYFVKSAWEKEQEKLITFTAGPMVSNVSDLLQGLRFDELSYYAKEMIRGQDELCYGIILDGRNNIIFHTAEEMEAKTLDDENSISAYVAIMMGRKTFIQPLVDPITGKEVLDVAMPVWDGEDLLGIIRLGYFKEPFDREIKRERMNIVLLVFSMMLIGGMVSIALARRISRPIRHLARVAVRVGRGELEVQAKVKSGGDEIEQLADAFNDMIKGLRERDYVKETFSRYVTKDVARKILKDREGIALGGEKRKVTVMMADIRDFTSTAEKLPPEEVISILNQYFEIMVDAVFNHEGTLDKFMGDCVMAVFGAPYYHGDDEERAVCCALDMQRELEKYNTERKKAGEIELEVGIGISTGFAVAGNIGSSKRVEYTVIGDTVNLAARLQALAGGGEIVISSATRDEVRDRVETVSLGPVKLKGMQKEITPFRLLNYIEAEERRRYKRVRVELPVRYKVIGKDTRFHEAIANIGGGGCLIKSKTEIPPESELEMEIDISGGNVLRGVMGRVVDCIPGAGPFFVRIEFMRISLEDRDEIIKFVYRAIDSGVEEA
ncbi:MAG: adenylate/guanylate cyclase domain-containing protein [bacterium]